MTAIAPTPSPAAPVPRFRNAAELLHALGDVPPERVLMDPLPGTATERDLLVLVERDKRLVELIDGTLVEKPVGLDEARIATLVSHLLNAWIIPRKLGIVAGADATLRMNSGRIRLPEVCFVSRDRYLSLPHPLPAVSPLAPDLAVEVLSETNTAAEMAQKRREYFSSGTRLAWIIDPSARTVCVYTSPEQPDRVLADTGTLDGGEVLPGFTVAVAELFKLPF